METGSLFLSLNNEKCVPTRIMLVPGDKVVKGRDNREWKNPNPKQVALNSMGRLPCLPIDENHSTDLAAPKGGSSPALGWMKNLLCADEGGAIWADVEWTDRGREVLEKKEYRFISPVFLTNEKGEINFILRAALTNSPNLDLPALNSERLENNKDTEVLMKEALLVLLGLPETSTDEEVLEAIKTLKASAGSEKVDTNSTKGTVDLAAYCPRADLNAMETRAVTAEKQLAELNSAQLKKDAEDLVEAAIINRKISPASKELYLNLCATRAELEKIKKIFSASPAILSTEAQTPENAPPSSGNVSLNSEEASFAKSAGYTPEEWKKLQEAGK